MARGVFVNLEVDASLCAREPRCRECVSSCPVDIFVHPDVRRRGIATRIMERLRALAVERGCGRFEWMVLDCLYTEAAR